MIKSFYMNTPLSYKLLDLLSCTVLGSVYQLSIEYSFKSDSDFYNYIAKLKNLKDLLLINRATRFLETFNLCSIHQELTSLRFDLAGNETYDPIPKFCELDGSVEFKILYIEPLYEQSYDQGMIKLFIIIYRQSLSLSCDSCAKSRFFGKSRECFER